MDPLQQGIEIIRLASRDHDFAVEHERRPGQPRENLDELRKIPRERLAGFRLQLDATLVAEHD